MGNNQPGLLPYSTWYRPIRRACLPEVCFSLILSHLRYIIADISYTTARADSTAAKYTTHDPERLSVLVGNVSDLGIAPTRRHFSMFNIIALSFNICNSWVAIATSLAIAISAGGTATLIYGIPLATIAYAATGASLAELASCYPTAGGQ